MLKTRLIPVTEVVWPPLEPAVRLEEQNLMTNTYTEALRVLAPDTGAYVNEVLPLLASPLGHLQQPFHPITNMVVTKANAYEPNFQETFWGANCWNYSFPARKMPVQLSFQL